MQIRTFKIINLYSAIKKNYEKPEKIYSGHLNKRDMSLWRVSYNFLLKVVLKICIQTINIKHLDDYNKINNIRSIMIYNIILKLHEKK